MRGDSAFLDHKILDTCAEADQYFAIVMASYPNVVDLADKLPEKTWRRFKPRAQREPRKKQQRRRRGNLRRRTARRQLIEEVDKQGNLFDLWRYRFALTNLTDRSAEEVLDLTYRRCDQENLIEQLQNGLAGMRMPTGELLSNAAFLCCARLAHNLSASKLLGAHLRPLTAEPALTIQEKAAKEPHASSSLA